MKIFLYKAEYCFYNKILVLIYNARQVFSVTLSYLPVQFTIKFETPALADTPPLFILRSVLGWKLRSLCCIAHSIECSSCIYKGTCAYTFLFETIIPAENEVVPGRNRASHPYAFTQDEKLGRQLVSKYKFTMTLFGKAIDYLPYLYAALVRAGKEGLFKTRTPFAITEVMAADKNILVAEDQLDVHVPAMVMEVSDKGESKKGEVLVELKSPLRFKAGGKYGLDFTAQDFMGCLYRRAKTLCQLYGKDDDDMQYSQTGAKKITGKALQWAERTHYSARQKAVMKLGGALGTFKIEGEFSPMDISLLEFAKNCNAGKNTNFGLGQVDFWPKWE